MQRSNSDALAALAQLLEPLLGELVFVGGAVTCILVTDEGAGEPRPTLDVDAIAEITSTPSMRRLAIAFVRSAFLKTQATERRCVGGCTQA